MEEITLFNIPSFEEMDRHLLSLMDESHWEIEETKLLDYSELLEYLTCDD